MAVRVNKSSFNIREKLTELGRRFGLKGSELIAAETAQDARDLVSAGRKNMVINGDMRISQRNNAGNAPSTSTYYLDRFMVRNNSAGTIRISQQSSTAGPPGFRSWLLAECDGADTTVDSSDYVRIQQYIEGYNCFMDWGYGNTDYITVSFWVKSNKTGTYCFNIEDGDALPVFCREYTIEQSDVWQKVELTIPPPSEGTWRGADNGIGLRMTWTLMAGSGHPLTANTWNTSYGMRTNNQVNFMDDANNNFYLTGVQLEVGKNATDFEYRSYGEELALCQRYFTRLYFPNSTYVAQGALQNSSNIRGSMIHLPTTLRSVPTASNSGSPNITFSGTGNATGLFTFLQPSTSNPVTVGSIIMTGVTNSQLHAYGTNFTSLGSTGQTSQLYAGNTAWINIDVEL